MLASLPILLALLASPAPEESPPPVAERVRSVSDAFLGAPYRRSPLGEGGGIDPDPRFRTDAFDCLTLVETAIALAHSDPKRAEAVLDDIRYIEGKTPGFASRLHLMEAQWLPDMMKKGYLREVTPEYGGDSIFTVSIELNASAWRQRQVLQNVVWQPSLEGRFEIPVIPLEAAERIASSLPEGLVVDVVREARPHDLTQITHTGILVVRDGERYVRHAALRERKVIDEPLAAFLARHRKMRMRRVLGIHLSEIRDNGERVEILLGEKPLTAESF